MGKIELKICMGTMCYVMGGAELKAAIDSLPHEEREQIQISYSPCLGMCNDGGEPPYVQVNGRTIARVSTAGDRKSTRLNSSHTLASRMPSSA